MESEGNVIIDKHHSGPEVTFSGSYAPEDHTIKGKWEIIVAEEGNDEEGVDEFLLTGTFEMKRKD